jgi:hypothetical protein
MYCSPAWSPVLQCDVNLVESVQRRFTKKIAGLSELSYSERLHSLGALSLQNLRTYTDMVTVYKSFRSGFAADFGLSLVSSHTRGCAIRLSQRRPNSRVTSTLFCCRAPSAWNKLPLHVVSSPSLPRNI